MVRGKVEIKRIESTSARHVSFSKRRQGLFKKAHELSVLCDADVALVIFSSCGRLYQFSSSDMTQILSRFNDCLESTRRPGPAERHPEARSDLQEPQEVENLKSKQRMQLFGKDLTDMDLQELHALDKQLHEGLMCVTTRKEQILMQQIEQSKMRKEQMMHENQILEGQVEEIQHSIISPINYLATPSRDDIHETTHILEPPDYNDDSETILLLGPPSPKGEDTNDGNHSLGNEIVPRVQGDTM